MNAEPESIKLLGQHRRGEQFEVGGHRFVDFLSHGTVLEDCTVTIRSSSRGVVFHGATLRRCLIQAKRRFMNFSWHDVLLEECVFKGWFVGCDFGPRPDAYVDHPHGIVSGCDFSQAHVHTCRFFRSEMARLKLPKWPSFTILEPEKNAADWLSIPFPESYRQVEQKLIAEAVPEYRVEGVVAACEHAGEIAKKHRVSIEEIKALVSGRLYILL
jgi:hypothetical protein